MNTRKRVTYMNDAAEVTEVYSPDNPQESLPDPVLYGNETSSATAMYYKIAEVQMPAGGAWEDSSCVLEIVDANYANDLIFPAVIVLTMNQEGAVSCYPFCVQMSGDRRVLSRLYLSYNSASGSKATLYFKTEDSFSSIGIRCLFQYVRSQLAASRWKFAATGGAGLASLPDADNNIALIDILNNHGVYFQMPVYGYWNNGVNVFGTDFNSYVMPGFYEILGSDSLPATNAPFANNNLTYDNCNWHLLVLRRTTTYVTQIAFSVRSDIAAQMRNYVNGSWTAWVVLGEQLASISQGCVLYNGATYYPVRLQEFDPKDCYDITDNKYSWLTGDSRYSGLANGQLYYFNGFVVDAEEDEDLGDEGKVIVVTVPRGGTSGSDSSWSTAFKNNAPVYAYLLAPIGNVDALKGSYTTITAGGTRDITVGVDVNNFKTVKLRFRYSTVQGIAECKIGEACTASLGVTSSLFEYYVSFSVSRKNATTITVSLSNLYQRTSDGQLSNITASASNVFIEDCWVCP